MPPVTLNGPIHGRIPYPLERELGRGAFGVVYACGDWALKVGLGDPRLIEAELTSDAELLRRHQAAFLHAALPIEDQGWHEEGGVRRRWYARRRAEGSAAQVEDPSERLRVAGEVARAAFWFAELGVVHGDYKPQNFVLRDGRAWVIDFAPWEAGAGGVKAAAPGVTPGYLARSGPGPQADVLAVGVSLYEILTGERLARSRRCVLAPGDAFQLARHGVPYAPLEAADQPALERVFAAVGLPSDRRSFVRQGLDAALRGEPWALGVLVDALAVEEAPAAEAHLEPLLAEVEEVVRWGEGLRQELEVARAEAARARTLAREVGRLGEELRELRAELERVRGELVQARSAETLHLTAGVELARQNFDLIAQLAQFAQLEDELAEARSAVTQREALAGELRRVEGELRRLREELAKERSRGRTEDAGTRRPVVVASRHPQAGEDLELEEDPVDGASWTWPQWAVTTQPGGGGTASSGEETVRVPDEAVGEPRPSRRRGWWAEWGYLLLASGLAGAAAVAAASALWLLAPRLEALFTPPPPTSLVTPPEPPPSEDGVILHVGPVPPTVESPFLGALKGVPSGHFRMGSPLGEEGHEDDEVQVEVSVGPRLWMESEFTRRQWLGLELDPTWGTKVCHDRTGKVPPDDGDCAVTGVSWCDAVWAANVASVKEGLGEVYELPSGFGEGLDSVTCNRLSEQVTVKFGATGYRLPTEAEWEWGARGGTGQVYGALDPKASATSVGWVDENADAVHVVCELARNGWGLCDMVGNVWEWTWDVYVARLPGGVDPIPPLAGGYRFGDGSLARVNRGGSWWDPSVSARVADRYWWGPGGRNFDRGFRLLRSVP